MDTIIFIVSKIVTLAILPENWIVAGLLIGFLAMLVGWWRLARLMTGVTVAFVMLVGFLPLGEMLIRPIESEFPVNPSLAQVDGIIVLGGPENPVVSHIWQQAEFGDGAERVMGALFLARRYPQAQVIAAGGGGSLRTLVSNAGGKESGVMARFFIDHGVDPARLLLEGRSRNTTENARLTFDLVKPQPGQKFVLVTSAFHLPRAMRSFQAAGWQNVTGWPVDHKSSTFIAGVGWDLTGHLSLLNIAVREWVGVLAYHILGR